VVDHGGVSEFDRADPLADAPPDILTASAAAANLPLGARRAIALVSEEGDPSWLKIGTAIGMGSPDAAFYPGSGRVHTPRPCASRSSC
jgi:hypothetical protein